MGKRILSLRYAATCADCGTALEVGAPARYYGRGKVYGTECHERGAARVSTPTPELEYGGACEDFPCCGHGSSSMCVSERRASARFSARRAVPTPQVAALPGMTPLGLEETPSDYPMSYNARAAELMDPFGSD